MWSFVWKISIKRVGLERNRILLTRQKRNRQHKLFSGRETGQGEKEVFSPPDYSWYILNFYTVYLFYLFKNKKAQGLHVVWHIAST